MKIAYCATHTDGDERHLSIRAFSENNKREAFVVNAGRFTEIAKEMASDPTVLWARESEPVIEPHPSQDRKSVVGLRSMDLAFRGRFHDGWADLNVYMGLSFRE